MSALLDVVERALAAARAAGAAAADAVLVESDGIETRVRGDEIDYVKHARERTLGIRAFAPGAKGLRSAVTSTSDLAPDTVQRMARETVALARATAEDPAAGLPEAGFETAPPDLALVDPGDRGVGVESRIESARRAERAARAVDPRITNSEGSEASSRFKRVAYGSTAGFLGEYESATHQLAAMPIASENGAMQMDYWWTIGRALARLASPEEVGRRAAERAIRRLGARRVPTCQAPVIFDPLTAASLLGHIAACVSGYAVYRETSFLAGRLGERVASELVTLVDDGRIPAGLGSRPFDGEGLPTRRNVVLERGRLASWLLDGYSARKLGLASTGNASRSAGSAPGVSSTNLWLEPGTRSPEEILATTERGFFVTSLFGHGFNPVTGDFSRGAAGLWIEGGRPVHAVEEVTIAGNLGAMLEAVDAVGNDLLWLGSVAAPTLRVARMTVAGD
jgi:PmbA protein